MSYILYVDEYSASREIIELKSCRCGFKHLFLNLSALSTDEETEAQDVSFNFYVPQFPHL